MGSVLKILLHQQSRSESPHDSGPERLGFLALVSEPQQRQCTFYSPLAHKKKALPNFPAPRLEYARDEMQRAKCLAAFLLHSSSMALLGQERTKEGLASLGCSPQNRVTPKPPLQHSGQNPFNSAVRPQLSVAIPPSFGGERDYTWREEQTLGAETARKDLQFYRIQGQVREGGK